MTDATHSFSWGTSSHGARLVVFWDAGRTERVLAPGEELVLGRGDDCDLQVLHGSVSRRQLVFRGGPPVTVEELGSTNGSRLRGRMLPRGQRVALGPGDIVEAGAAVVLLQNAREIAVPGPAVGEGAALPTVAPPPLPLSPNAAEAPASMMRGVLRTIELAAPSSLSILLTGETGVGKEVLAEKIHERSTRAEGPLVRINCAALPETLLEGELFGFERGAFTGAVARKTGLLEAAHGGTLLLDEVGELPLATQVKLLRVLESREVLRLGAVKTTPIDIRLVSATHRDLEQAVASGGFRADLFFRINGITITIPPLRVRTDEILGLAQTFLEGAVARDRLPRTHLSKDATAALLAYPWPGNVRELKNVIERAVVMAAGAEVGLAHLMLPRHVAATGGPTTPEAVDEGLWDELQRRERERIVDALAKTGGNQTAAAKMLGIARRTLINRMKQFGLDKKGG